MLQLFQCEVQSEGERSALSLHFYVLYPAGRAFLLASLSACTKSFASLVFCVVGSEPTTRLRDD